MHQTMAKHLSGAFLPYINNYKEILAKEYFEYFKLFQEYRETKHLNKFITVCDFVGRFHSPLTDLSKKVRPYILLNNEETVSFGVAQMQPTILAKILKQHVGSNTFSDAIEEGKDIYEFLQQKEE